MENKTDPLTENLSHVLYGECSDPKCALHHPIGAPGMNRRDMTMFIAGAQVVVDRFRNVTNESLGLDPSASSPTQRLRRIEAMMRDDVERWLFEIPEKRKRGRIKKRKGRRAINVFR